MGRMVIIYIAAQMATVKCSIENRYQTHQCLSVVSSGIYETGS